MPVYPNINQITDKLVAETLRIAFDKIYQALAQQELIDNQGLLLPDDKPKLGRTDVGYVYWANDYDRLYRWDGVRWQDYPGQPQRYAIQFFPLNNPPTSPGWLRCNGSYGNASTPEGRTVQFKAPIMNELDGQQPWIRV